MTIVAGSLGDMEQHPQNW